MRILGVIPARGGSKGIPNKNLAQLRGVPLIAYTIRAAQQASVIAKLVVSTDSEAIREAAVGLGSNVLMRPAELATDTTPTPPVVAHVLHAVESVDGRFDAVMLLQPTSPLRTSSDIERAASTFAANPAADSLISCYDGSATHPSIMYRLCGDRLAPLFGHDQPRRRQDFESVYVRNGAIYLTRRHLIVEEGRLVGDHPLALKMPRERSINIDEPVDLELAAFWLSHAPPI